MLINVVYIVQIVIQFTPIIGQQQVLQVPQQSHMECKLIKVESGDVIADTLDRLGCRQ